MAHQEAREPIVGLVLALCIPGGGHAYVQRWTDVVVILAVLVALVLWTPWWCWTGFHAFQAVAAMGAIVGWNREHSSDLTAPVPPPKRRGEDR
jgi:hypothetical protein